MTTNAEHSVKRMHSYITDDPDRPIALVNEDFSCQVIMLIASPCCRPQTWNCMCHSRVWSNQRLSELLKQDTDAPLSLSRPSYTSTRHPRAPDFVWFCTGNRKFHAHLLTFALNSWWYTCSFNSLIPSLKRGKYSFCFFISEFWLLENSKGEYFQMEIEEHRLKRK